MVIIAVIGFFFFFACCCFIAYRAVSVASVTELKVRILVAHRSLTGGWKMDSLCTGVKTEFSSER